MSRKLSTVPTRVLILGTGLIGSSLGLALRALGPGFDGMVLGWDANADELRTAAAMGAIHEALPSRDAVLQPGIADVYVLATPVLPILDWMGRLAPVVGAHQLVTDTGSTKHAITERAQTLFGSVGQAAFLPGHPMAGKETGGAAMAEAGLFRDAPWLFTAASEAPDSPLALQFRAWIEAIGAQPRDLASAQHDVLCAWVSHLPQMLSTALAALLEETFADDPEGRALVESIGGRALRETTRLGASPYSMWRDIALTNTEPIGATLSALEQQLAHMREGLRSPSLREAFGMANRFRSR